MRLRNSSSEMRSFIGDVERVVVGGERPGVGAARDRLQHRSLELDESALVEHAAHRAQHRRACQEVPAGLLVGDQVQVAPALLQVGVLQAVPLLGQRPQRLREHRPSIGEHAELALARRADAAGDPDDVAEVDLAEQREEVVGQVRAARDDLQVAGAIAQHEELQLADVALAHHASGHGDDVAGDRVGFEVRVRGAHVGRRGGSPTPSARSSVSANGGMPAASSRCIDSRRAARISASRAPGSSRSPIGGHRVLLEDEPQALEREPRLVAVDRGAVRDHDRGETARRDRSRRPAARRGCA